jgi:DNA-binding transcriptional LysR family regulator
VEEEGLHGVIVGEDEIVLAAAPSLIPSLGLMRKHPEDHIASLPIVLREVGSGTRRSALSALENAGIAPEELNVVLEIGSNDAAREAALAGVGAALLSRRAVERELQAGDLVALPLLKKSLTRPFVLVTREHRTLSPGAAALVRLLKKRMR